MSEWIDLVTGGSKSIEREIAARLAVFGHRVYVGSCDLAAGMAAAGPSGGVFTEGGLLPW